MIANGSGLNPSSPAVCSERGHVRRFIDVLRISLLLISSAALNALSAPIYHYTYTGNPYNLSAIPPYTTSDFVSLEIISPTPLLASSADQAVTPGLSLSMSDGVQTLQLPMQLGQTSDGESYITGGGSLFVYDLDSSGLPVNWFVSIHRSVFSNPVPFGIPFISHIGTENTLGPSGPNLFDNACIGGGGCGPIAATAENPGQWRLTIESTSPIPEPSVPLLLVVGIAAIAVLFPSRTRHRLRAFHLL